jgi:PAS domain S-box-containing protein
MNRGVETLKSEDWSAAATGWQEAAGLLRLQGDALEASANAIVITDAAGTIEWVNRAFVELTGYSRDEVIGRSPRLLKSDRHDSVFYDGMWQTIRAGKVWHGELVNRRKDGTLYAEEQTITPVRGDSGEIEHYIGVKQDVSRRKEMEDALRERESLYQETFNEAPVGIAQTAPDGRYIKVNRRLCEMLGYSAEELLRLNFRELTFPDDLGRDLACIEKLLAGEIQSHRIEKRYVRKDGQVVWVSRTASLRRDASGQPEYFLVVTEDITDRKQAEVRLAAERQFFDAAIDALPGIFYLFDQKGRLWRWNRNLEGVTGYSSDEIAAMHPREFFAGDEQRLIEQKIGEVLEKGEATVEASLVCKDGRKLPYFLTGARTLRGQTPCVIGMGVDLTERKKLEAQFLRAQRMESIGTLASGVAHDLNNILAPILMAEQLLRMKTHDDESLSLLDAIATSTKRGTDVVRQVLTFARGVGGERVLLQPRHLIREMAKIAAETFPRSVAVRFDGVSDLWPVTGDATQLHQVLMNLCVNARDAMPGGGVLTLSAANVHCDQRDLAAPPDLNPGPYVVVRVHDSGTGIPADIIDKIFDPFFTTKEVGKGTGLGLSTVAGIVRSHGGGISVISKVGEGTTFNVFLPAAPSECAAEADSESQALPSGRGEIVLVVDDEENIRDVTRSILTRHGYEVLTAGDGTEAVAMVAQLPGRIKLVLTDIMMPFMDGMALIRALRRIDPRIKTIACSGLAQNDKAAELNELGVRIFLDKPYSAAKLLTGIHDLLHPQST